MARNFFATVESTHIILIGMMGSGKSTIGKQLAIQLQRPFYDIDAVIEEKTQQKITDIFSVQSEDAFRMLETQSLRSVLQNPEPSVVATGGGVIRREENRQLLQHSCVVYLKASVDILAARLENETDARPLLGNLSNLSNGQSLKETLKTLLLDREKDYMACSHYQLQQTSDKSVDTLVLEIMEFLL